jgi:hypothetical protein
MMPGRRLMFLIAGAIALAVGSAPAQQPRDGAPPPPRAGTAIVSGIVMSTDTPPRPVRRARVTLGSPVLPMMLAGITDDDGRFRIERVPPGRYSVQAAKESYLTAQLDAPRPGYPGRPIVLADGGEHSVTLRISRGSVMSGTVTDADGGPVAGAIVTMLRFGYQATGDRAPRAVGGFPTDDRGVYRAFGLAPGDYLVSAAARGPSGPRRVPSASEIRRARAQVTASRPSLFSKVPGMPAPAAPPRPAVEPTEPARSVVMAPAYHPGSTRLAQARVITLGAAEERHGIDITLEHVPVATIEGMVTGTAGPANAFVTLTPAESPRGRSGEFVRTNRAGANGVFRFDNVPPGEYQVIASSFSGGEMAGWDTAPVVVDGDDMTGLALTLRPAFTIAGQLVFDGGKPPAALLAILKTSLPVMPPLAGPQPPPMLQTAADGRFTISGIVPGSLRPLPGLQGVRSSLGGWWLHSITLGGRELLDAPLDIRANADDAVVTFSTRASEIAGRVTGPDGQPVAGPHLIVFSANTAHWYPLSRRIVAHPLPADGRYVMRNLPPGDYLLVVDDDVDPGQWFDPSYLGRAVGQASREDPGIRKDIARSRACRADNRAGQQGPWLSFAGSVGRCTLALVVAVGVTLDAQRRGRFVRADPDGDSGELRRPLQLLPDRVRRQLRRRRRGLERGLPAGGHEPVDPAVGTDQDDHQPRRRRRAEPRRPPDERPAALPLPVRHDDRGWRRVLRARTRGADARVPAQGRLPVGRRLLGRVRLGGLGARVREGAAAARTPWVDLPLDHPIFRSQFVVERMPQIPSINFWRGSGGGTSERYDSQVPRARAILDRHGNVMVLATHNTDIGDSWEQEAADPQYFYMFSVDGYAFGINVLLYAMTH